jgi:uncharacterized OB-fold protein
MLDTAIQSFFEGDGPDSQFRAGLKAGKFFVQQCMDCGRHLFYPRALCTFCASPRLQFKEACGKGRVYSATIVRQKPEAGGDYNVSLIDLEEGPRMMSRVVGMPPEEVAIGTPVRAKIAEIDGALAVVFESA